LIFTLIESTFCRWACCCRCRVLALEKKNQIQTPNQASSKDSLSDRFLFRLWALFRPGALFRSGALFRTLDLPFELGWISTISDVPSELLRSSSKSSSYNDMQVT
jgi:hypothetical protein